MIDYTEIHADINVGDQVYTLGGYRETGHNYHYEPAIMGPYTVEKKSDAGRLCVKLYGSKASYTDKIFYKSKATALQTVLNRSVDREISLKRQITQERQLQAACAAAIEEAE